MMNVIRATLTGTYEVIGNPMNADCVIGQSFGASEHGPGAANIHLASFILDNCQGRPLILQSEIADAVMGAAPVACVVQGKPSTAGGGELDSWRVLEEAADYMKQNQFSRPLLVAHAYHVGRVAMQAKRQGLEPIVPPGLPRAFDAKSTQPWTRNPRSWAAREIPGLAYLRFKGRL